MISNINERAAKNTAKAKKALAIVAAESKEDEDAAPARVDSRCECGPWHVGARGRGVVDPGYSADMRLALTARRYDQCVGRMAA